MINCTFWTFWVVAILMLFIITVEFIIVKYYFCYCFSFQIYLSISGVRTNNILAIYCWPYLQYPYCNMISILQYQLVQYRTIIVEIFINYYYYYKLGHFHNKKMWIHNSINCHHQTHPHQRLRYLQHHFH